MRGALVALFVVHAFVLGAALTALARRVVGAFEGGIDVRELVPPRAGAAPAAVLVASYAVAVAVLHLRPRWGWAYCVALAVAQGARAAFEGTLPLLTVVVLVLLGRRSVRGAFTHTRERPAER